VLGRQQPTRVRRDVRRSRRADNVCQLDHGTPGPRPVRAR
jgi:hypothetical protein